MTYRFYDVVNQFLSLIYLLLGICHNKTVQVFVLVTGMSSVRLSLALLDGAFAADSDLGSRLRLHLLERVTAWADEEADC